jgi:hypothetical protein
MTLRLHYTNLAIRLKPGAWGAGNPPREAQRARTADGARRLWTKNGLPENLDTNGPRRKQAQELCLFGSHQYSDGTSSVVAPRSASVMIQSLAPFERVYAESSRKP